ncbi:MAG: SUMF1/EgtB/PvdO family nonheme iron enzyme [Bacteroidales bacterium]|nr:SUMF1/EgtB/PvdO family nonheme iron enzyme [Bacteroidales bacterium]
MKNSVLTILVFILTIAGCFAQQKTKLTVNELTDNKLPDYYLQYSEFTDPGEYVYMYANLPDSLPELCKLIKSQFIHPFAELQKYSEQIPEERWNEMVNYPTVKSILEGLLSYDSSGIVPDRIPENRLILGCREYAILLASVLKYRGIPARVRCGHATYIMPDFHVSHTICEVWNNKENRWMLVDPGMNMVDFSREKFDFSNEAWLQLQKNEIDPDYYAIPGRYSGFASILGKIGHDLAALLGSEYTIFEYSPILEGTFENNNQLNTEQIELLNKICELMITLDATNLKKLQKIYNDFPEIQVTKSFFEYQKQKEAKNENTSDTKNTSLNDLNIEFVDIPGGTFIMGSPESEVGRKDDEVQHEVTVSAFKMSKYTITCEQYNLFCQSTGRRKMWYGPYGNDKNPVSQVTWTDAKEFAEWMGCRLPTEAEWEFAARAGTTTAFYTGDCLSTDQANFNGKEPYANCETGTNRKKPIPAGSFDPNPYGLFDMHGNMLEWCSDWYGQYIINDTINPKGPETGEFRVARGGGWFQQTNECRSAYRDRIPQGNRGAGISFRLVKDE